MIFIVASPPGIRLESRQEIDIALGAEALSQDRTEAASSVIFQRRQNPSISA
jgi:hypothetical protein